MLLYHETEEGRYSLFCVAKAAEKKSGDWRVSFDAKWAKLGGS